MTEPDPIEQAIAVKLAEIGFDGDCDHAAALVRAAIDPLIISRDVYGQVKDALSAARRALGPDDRPFLDDAIGRLQARIKFLESERDIVDAFTIEDLQRRIATLEAALREAEMVIGNEWPRPSVVDVLGTIRAALGEQASTAVPVPTESKLAPEEPPQAGKRTMDLLEGGRRRRTSG